MHTKYIVHQLNDLNPKNQLEIDSKNLSMSIFELYFSPCQIFMWRNDGRSILKKFYALKNPINRKIFVKKKSVFVIYFLDYSSNLERKLGGFNNNDPGQDRFST